MYGVSSPQLLWLLRTIVGWHNLAALTTPTKVSRTSPELNMDTNVTTHTATNPTAPMEERKESFGL